MNIELENYLIRKFNTLYGAGFKFDCNDGWFRIVLWLSKYLTSYTELQNIKATESRQYEPVKPITVTYVGDSLGILKFNTLGGNVHTDAVISFACYISGFMCAYTGSINNVVFCVRPNMFNTCVLQPNMDSSNYSHVDDDELRDILTRISYNNALDL